MAEQQPICHICGSKMRNIDKREKQIVTLLGSCKYSRSYYGCYCGAHAIPKDESLGVFCTKFTQAVKRVTAQIAASDSFKDTSANLKHLCGIEMSAKEAHYLRNWSRNHRPKGSRN